MKLGNILLATAGLFIGFLTIIIPIAKEYHTLDANAEAIIFPLPESQRTNHQNLAVQQTDYYLAYPGILPDHPLYWLKMIRDRISLELTSSPNLRFEKLLLYSDKRIGAAQVLVKGNKVSLGISTATKAEKYFTQAVDELAKAKTQKLATQLMLDKAVKASQKHLELVDTITRELPNDDKGAMEPIVLLSQTNAKRVLQLAGKTK